MDKISAEENIGRLMDEYQNLVLSICYKMTKDYFASQDLTQETFLSAFVHIKEIPLDHEKNWLCRVASNKCIDYLRAKTRKQDMDTDEEEMLACPSKIGRPEHEAMETSVKEELKENCRKLKKPYDVIAYEYFYMEKKPAEIAKASDENLKTVQTRIYRARNMLRKIYENMEGSG